MHYRYLRAEGPLCGVRYIGSIPLYIKMESIRFKEEGTKSEISTFLAENFNGFLATLEDSKPRVRPYQFMLEDEGKLCFSTNNTKEVCKQLKVNPSMEFSATNKGGGWIRLNGEVKFSSDRKLKEKILGKSEVVLSLYKTADHPAFEVFYLDHGVAQIMDAPGQAPRRIEF
jgi:uncharacterized pyridoxamine 5'-phosphate oxidase family protein